MHGHSHAHANSHTQEHSGGHAHEHSPSHDHGHGSEGRTFGSLLGLVGFAFALGFVHEEEFAIIALSAGKASPWLVMGAYAVAVAASLVLLTCAAIATLNRLESRLHGHQDKLPRISAVILGAMGLAYMLGVF